MSESIHQLLPRVMRDVGNIGKDQKNTFQGYNFRGIDDVLNHCNPALTKHGVTVSVKVSKHRLEEVQTQKGFRVKVSLKMAVTFSAPDGSSVTNTTVGESHDSNGDKASNKAMSAAFKYAMFYGLCIPVDASAIDDSDRDDKQDPAPKKSPEEVATEAAEAFDGQIIEDEPRTDDQLEGMMEYVKKIGDLPDEHGKVLDTATVAEWASNGRTNLLSELFKTEATKALRALNISLQKREELAGDQLP